MAFFFAPLFSAYVYKKNSEHHLAPITMLCSSYYYWEEEPCLAEDCLPTDPPVYGSVFGRTRILARNPTAGFLFFFCCFSSRVLFVRYIVFFVVFVYCMCLFLARFTSFFCCFCLLFGYATSFLLIHEWTKLFFYCICFCVLFWQKGARSSATRWPTSVRRCTKICRSGATTCSG